MVFPFHNNYHILLKKLCSILCRPWLKSRPKPPQLLLHPFNLSHCSHNYVSVAGSFKGFEAY